MFFQIEDSFGSDRIDEKLLAVIVFVRQLTWSRNGDAGSLVFLLWVRRRKSFSKRGSAAKCPHYWAFALAGPDETTDALL